MLTFCFPQRWCGYFVRSRIISWLVAFALGWGGSLDLSATSVLPPSFEELVHQSTLVFRGKVVAVESIWKEHAGKRHLTTQVRLEVERVLKGDQTASLLLTFIGGERDGYRMQVLGMPQFVAGDHGVFFVESTSNHFCPLVRLRHGKYRITTDVDGTARVLRDDHSPLAEPGRVRVPLGADSPARAAAVSAGQTLTLADFERAISQQVAADTMTNSVIP